MNQYIWQHKAWPNFKWDANAIINNLSHCNYRRGQILGRVASLGMEYNLEAQAEVLGAEILKTSAIEGMKLDPDSVRSSVARRLGLPDAGLTHKDRHAEGITDVLIDATTNYDKPLTVERLHGWQAALFPTGYSGMHRIKVGEFRGEFPMQVVSGPFGKERVHYEAPPSREVDKHIKNFLNWWCEPQEHCDGIIRAAISGFWFVSIHPYEDGNGRLARAITDMALAQDEKMSARYYSLSSQIMEERNNYYDILEKSQKGDLDITDWLLWFLGCFKRALDKSEALIAGVLQKARFWEVHNQTDLNARQRKTVIRLLEAGPGGFEGGMTTRKYAGMNKTSRATSYRELVDLVNKKVLAPNEGKGRSVSYDLVWD